MMSRNICIYEIQKSPVLNLKTYADLAAEGLNLFLLGLYMLFSGNIQTITIPTKIDKEFCHMTLESVLAIPALNK